MRTILSIGLLSLAIVGSAAVKLQPPMISDSDDMLRVTLALTDKNGTELNKDNLYFSVFLNDSSEPFEFTTQEFGYIASNMSEIPYGYSDSQSYDIWSSEGTVTIYHPASWNGFKKLGVMAVYHDADEKYESELVYTDGTTGGGGDTPNPGDDPDESLLISNPEGEKTMTIRTSSVFYKLGGVDIYSGIDTGSATDYVKSTDGKIYLKCVMGGNVTGNYLKLEPSASSASQYVAKLPQLVMVEEYDGVKYGYYASRLVKENIAEKPDSISYLVTPGASNEIVFSLSEDGSLRMNEQTENVILGLTYSDGSWTGFGDAALNDESVADKIVKLPADAELRKFIFSYEWGNYSEYGRMEKFIDGAVVGNEIYLNNPYNMNADQWFKGVIDNGKVVFDCGQIMGIDPESNRYLIFRGGNMTKGEDGWYRYSDAEQLVFDYDAETSGFSKNPSVSMYVSQGFGTRGFNTNYDFPSVKLFNEQITGLQNPSWRFVAEDGTFDNFGYSYAQVSIPQVDRDGNQLNTNNLYYSIYVGDSQTPYVFEASAYANDFKDDTTEIPFNYSGNDFYPYAPGSDIHTFFTYFSTDDLRMGVQSIYYDAEGNVHKSDIVYRETAGIDGIEVSDNHDSKVYYDLFGRRVDNPGKGIYICNGKKVVVR